ncbi:MAG TPA: ArsA-related P-loop ATPase [Thermodesulfobacteriota bacterium]|nr:ArsA-related P-loop ATPase [Thermodesulfobacteriota bacterium]
MTITDILGKKLIVITGKGGVGKTTVSLALAFLNARLGRRPVYVTLKEVRPGYPFFGFTGGVGSGETELAPGIRAHYIDPSAALDEYVKERFVRLYPLYAAILKSKAISGFFDAAPGLKELITIGKVWHLGNRPGGYDQVIFDAPSTGHAVPILDLPSRVLDMVRGGAFRSHIEWVEGFLKDPGKTAVLAVSAPEDMAVGETLELAGSVREAGINVLGAVLNYAVESPFTLAEEEAVLEAAEGSSRELEAIRLARLTISRARATAKYGKVLGRSLSGAVLTAPRILKKELSLEDLSELSREIENQAARP